MNETSRASSGIEDLVTIVLVYSGNDPKGFVSDLDSDLALKYLDVPVLVGIAGWDGLDGQDLKSGRKNVEIVLTSETSESRTWFELIRKVETDFVFVGRDIRRIYPKVIFSVQLLDKQLVWFNELKCLLRKISLAFYFLQV